MTGAPEKILDLVSRYEREMGALQSSAYGEADTRKEFIEPLFAALGWDVANTKGHAEAYKDVVNEYSLKTGGSVSAPDYAFRVGGSKVFFVEAKRPQVDLISDGKPAFQLRRYGWTAQLPVSVLTNFRHLAVYDCAVQPTASDPPSTGRTHLVQWSELPARWSELEALLGQDAILKGSLHRYATAASSRRGTSPVDEAFLAQMDEWRNDLARNLARRNQNLTVPELNEAVQQTLDRLLFLRIAEDRGIEPYETLLDQTDKKSVYPRLMNVFRAADTRYNSGLFHFRSERGVTGAPDRLTPNLTIDDDVIRGIVKGMYYPTSPYEFSVFPADILGQVYEQFLGKVIRLTAAHESRVEYKPEVRKAGGVYYTPSHIVDYIVERTLGKRLEGKSPQTALRTRVLDPACGSGSFLIGAYDYLVRWFTDAYLDTDEKSRSRAMFLDRAGQWRLKLSERKRILTSCIYGVDIDQQAVEVTKLSLMLKVLEGESSETIHNQMQMFPSGRVLPDLENNVQCGNSLVSPDVSDYLTLTEDEERLLNPFDWQVAFPRIIEDGGFHVVIGNPPYNVLEKDRDAASWPHATLRDYLPHNRDYAGALGGKLNIYRLFLVRAVGLTRQGGMFGMIVPMGIVADVSTAGTRRYVLGALREPQFDCFPQKDDPSRRVFKLAKLSTAVVTGSRSAKPVKGSEPLSTRVFPADRLDDAPIENRLTVAECALLDPVASPVPLADEDEWELCVRLHTHPGVRRLAELSDSYTVTRGEINQKVFRDYIGSEGGEREPLLKGVEVGPFEQHESLSQGYREWFDADQFLVDYPRRRRPVERRIATQRITGVDERRRLVAAVISSPTWFADSTNSVAPVDGGPLSLDYLVALLNSDLLQWRFRLTGTNNNVATNELLSLPVRVPEPSEPADGALYDRIADMGRGLAATKADLRGMQSASIADRLTRRLDATWSTLNAAVYEFYGLEQPDRALVASRLEKKPLVAVGDEDDGE